MKYDILNTASYNIHPQLLMQNLTYSLSYNVPPPISHTRLDLLANEYDHKCR